MTELPIQALLLEVVAILDEAGVPYGIMGGFAVRTWGIPRPTYDADLAITADAATLADLLERLREADFDVPLEYAAGFTDVVAGMQKVKVTRFVDRSVWDVDLFLANAPLLESAMGRRRRVTLAGQPVDVLAPEDIILLKLVAHRRKDQLDVEEILRITTDLDHSYLATWAATLRVSDRLREFLSP